MGTRPSLSLLTNPGSLIFGTLEASISIFAWPSSRSLPTRITPSDTVLLVVTLRVRRSTASGEPLAKMKPLIVTRPLSVTFVFSTTGWREEHSVTGPTWVRNAPDGHACETDVPPPPSLEEPEPPP